MNTIIKEWRQKPQDFTAIKRHLKLDTILFANGLGLLATSKNNLQ
jgi:hypothetical protein